MVKGRSKRNMEQQKIITALYIHINWDKKSFIKIFSIKITQKSSNFKTTYIPDYFPFLSGEIFIAITGSFGSYIAEDSSYAS